MDIVKKLRERPLRYAAETELEAQERRQREREDGADEITSLREEIARLRAENAWQTIETAPDDESVWLYGGWISTGDEAVANTGVVAWLDRGVWVVEEGETFMRGATVVKGPTHWKRLPAPPADIATAIREGGKKDE